ncbi:hypothetical protein LguiA_014215 [Lonicera macranthoides]
MYAARLVPRAQLECRRAQQCRAQLECRRAQQNKPPMDNGSRQPTQFKWVINANGSLQRHDSEDLLNNVCQTAIWRADSLNAGSNQKLKSTFWPREKEEKGDVSVTTKRRHLHAIKPNYGGDECDLPKSLKGLFSLDSFLVFLSLLCMCVAHGFSV